MDELKPLVTDIASPYDCDAVERRFQSYVEAGAPEDIARDVARLRPLTSSSDVIDLAKAVNWPLGAVGRLYHAVGARFMFDRLRAAGNQLSSTLHWDRLAMRRLIEDLYGSQQAICEGMMDYVKTERTDLAKDLASAGSGLGRRGGCGLGGVPGHHGPARRPGARGSVLGGRLDAVESGHLLDAIA